MYLVKGPLSLKSALLRKQSVLNRKQREQSAESGCLVTGQTDGRTDIQRSAANGPNGPPDAPADSDSSSFIPVTDSLMRFHSSINPYWSLPTTLTKVKSNNLLSNTAYVRE